MTVRTAAWSLPKRMWIQVICFEQEACSSGRPKLRIPSSMAIEGATSAIRSNENDSENRGQQTLT